MTIFRKNLFISLLVSLTIVIYSCEQTQLDEITTTTEQNLEAFDGTTTDVVELGSSEENTVLYEGTIYDINDPMIWDILDQNEESSMIRDHEGQIHLFDNTEEAEQFENELSNQFNIEDRAVDNRLRLILYAQSNFTRKIFTDDAPVIPPLVLGSDGTRRARLVGQIVPSFANRMRSMRLVSRSKNFGSTNLEYRAHLMATSNTPPSNFNALDDFIATPGPFNFSTDKPTRPGTAKLRNQVNTLGLPGDIARGVAIFIIAD